MTIEHFDCVVVGAPTAESQISPDDHIAVSIILLIFSNNFYKSLSMLLANHTLSTSLVLFPLKLIRCLFALGTGVTRHEGFLR